MRERIMLALVQPAGVVHVQMVSPVNVHFWGDGRKVLMLDAIPFLPTNDMRTYQLTLLLTEKCNLRCSYCHCDKSFLSSMDESTAIAAIDRVIDQRPKDEPLNILLMGGEPFMAFPLIKTIVAYVGEKYPAKKVFFKAVSNGTLIHGDVQDWLIAHKDTFEVTLSLDGDRETHNRNRCNSYDKIDFDFFKHRYGRNTTVSSVVVPETLGCFANNVISMEKDFGIKYVLADGVEWDIERDGPELERQLDILIEHYLSHPNIHPMSLLSYAIWCINGDFSPERCVPGVFSSCIAPDGNEYACHRTTTYYNNGKWVVPAEKINLKEVGLLKDECHNCCARSICCACPASVASIQSDANLADITCKLNKILLRSNAKLVIRMFLECPEHIHLKSRPAKMQLAMLEGAKEILEKL